MDSFLNFIFGTVKFFIFLGISAIILVVIHGTITKYNEQKYITAYYNGTDKGIILDCVIDTSKPKYCLQL